MGAVAIAAAAAGAGISAIGALSSASDQAALDTTKAGISRQQSDEIASRELSNETIRNQNAYRQKLAFGAAYAGSGKAGTGIGSQLEIQRQADQANVMANRDATFQEKMLQQQAGVDTAIAQETLSAGYWNAASSILGGISSAGRIAAAGQGGTGTESLPAMPSSSSYPTSPGSTGTWQGGSHGYGYGYGGFG